MGKLSQMCIVFMLFMILNNGGLKSSQANTGKAIEDEEVIEKWKNTTNNSITNSTLSDANPEKGIEEEEVIGKWKNNTNISTTDSISSDDYSIGRFLQNLAASLGGFFVFLVITAGTGMFIYWRNKKKIQNDNKEQLQKCIQCERHLQADHRWLRSQFTRKLSTIKEEDDAMVEEEEKEMEEMGKGKKEKEQKESEEEEKNESNEEGNNISIEIDPPAVKFHA